MKSTDPEEEGSEYSAGFQEKLQQERAWISSPSESQSFVEGIYSQIAILNASVSSSS